MKPSCAADFERKFVHPMPGRTLIVGSRIYKDKPDRRELYEDAVGVDMLAGPGVDRVVNLEKRIPARLGKFAHIECISVLEHSQRPWLLAANLEQLLEEGGTLHVQVPFVWRVHAYPNDYWRFTRNGVIALFPGIEFSVVAQVHTEMKRNDLVPAVDVDGHPYLARTEICAFGVKK